MADQQYATEIQVHVGGKRLESNEIQTALVEQDMMQADMCIVSLDNTSRGFSGEIKMGDPLRVSMGRVDKGPEQVFDGEVVSVEPRYSSEGESKCIVRGFDRLHRMVRGRFSRAWEKAPESAILKEVAGAHGLGVQTDVNEEQVFVYQHNQTDLEFLMHRAKVHGAEVSVEGSTLKFMKPDLQKAFGGIALELKSGADYELKSFTPRMSAGGIVSSVEVRGWDPVKKQPIVHRSTPQSSKLPHGQLGGMLAPSAAGSLGQEVSYSVDSPVFDLAEAQQKADSLLYDAMMSFLTGTGVCVGTPSLKKGQVVEIKLYNKDLTINDNYRFNGRYQLTGVTHRYTREKSGNFGGYQTLVRVRRDAHQG